MILGVTGTIGSGKSTVCRIFRDLGCPVVSADEIGHKILEKESVKDKIREVFGDVFDEKGTVSRTLLAKKAFSDKNSLKKLNDITHPEIKNKIRKETEKLSADNRVVVCEIPLLFECGWEDLADKILVVYVSDETAVERLVGRGMTAEEAEKRLKYQMKTPEKLKKADFLLSNEDNFEKLAFKVAKLLNKC